MSSSRFDSSDDVSWLPPAVSRRAAPQPRTESEEREPLGPVTRAGSPARPAVPETGSATEGVQGSAGAASVPVEPEHTPTADRDEPAADALPWLEGSSVASTPSHQEEEDQATLVEPPSEELSSAEAAPVDWQAWDHTATDGGSVVATDEEHGPGAEAEREPMPEAALEESAPLVQAESSPDPEDVEPGEVLEPVPGVSAPAEEESAAGRSPDPVPDEWWDVEAQALEETVPWAESGEAPSVEGFEWDVEPELEPASDADEPLLDEELLTLPEWGTEQEPTEAPGQELPEPVAGSEADLQARPDLDTPSASGTPARVIEDQGPENEPAGGPPLEDLAARLERIAGLLRDGRPLDLLHSTDDPLQVLIAGYALGAAERGRVSRGRGPSDQRDG